MCIRDSIRAYLHGRPFAPQRQPRREGQNAPYKLGYHLDERDVYKRQRENSCYLLEKEDDEFLYVKDLCSEDEGEFKITKKSLKDVYKRQQAVSATHARHSR